VRGALIGDGYRKERLVAGVNFIRDQSMLTVGVTVLPRLLGNYGQTGSSSTIIVSVRHALYEGPNLSAVLPSYTRSPRGQ
jgi:hypothetical protein